MPQDEGSVQNLHGMYFFLSIPALLTNLIAQILKEFPWYDDLLSVMGGILPCLSEQSYHFQVWTMPQNIFLFHQLQAALTLTYCALGALNLAVSHTFLLVSLILPPLAVSHTLLPISLTLPPYPPSLGSQPYPPTSDGQLYHPASGSQLYHPASDGQPFPPPGHHHDSPLDDDDDDDDTMPLDYNDNAMDFHSVTYNSLLSSP